MKVHGSLMVHKNKYNTICYNMQYLYTNYSQHHIKYNTVHYITNAYITTTIYKEHYLLSRHILVCVINIKPVTLACMKFI
jgi:hypothetical protein